MNIQTTAIKDLLILKPNVYGDERGFFMESYNQAQFNSILQTHNQPQTVFVQDNQSRSSQGVLRGLHYQVGDAAQGKLVRVTSGAVWDVAVDLRPTSVSYGQWHGVELSAHNQLQFWIPPGFAHGFLVLSQSADFLYKTTQYYQPNAERCIVWNDPVLNIAWPTDQLHGQAVLVSEKDQKGGYFK